MAALTCVECDVPLSRKGGQALAHLKQIHGESGWIALVLGEHVGPKYGLKPFMNIKQFTKAVDNGLNLVGSLRHEGIGESVNGIRLTESNIGSHPVYLLGPVYRVEGFFLTSRKIRWMAKAIMDFSDNGTKRVRIVATRH